MGGVSWTNLEEFEEVFIALVRSEASGGAMELDWARVVQQNGREY